MKRRFKRLSVERNESSSSKLVFSCEKMVESVCWYSNIPGTHCKSFISISLVLYFSTGARFRWEYSWSQGPRADITFSNWKPMEPNNKRAQENCVEINRGPRGRWNDLLCMRRRPAICKYSIVQWNENQ